MRLSDLQELRAESWVQTVDELLVKPRSQIPGIGSLRGTFSIVDGLNRLNSETNTPKENEGAERINSSHLC